MERSLDGGRICAGTEFLSHAMERSLNGGRICEGVREEISGW